MKTKTFKLETFYARIYCDKCGEELKDTGICKTICPPLYEHKCPKCGNVYYVNDLYPKIFYKEIESEDLHDRSI